jgi:hypothetical protein
MKELTTTATSLQMISEADASQLNAFQKELGKSPKKESVKQNQFANNAAYLEIGYLEMQLDRKYFGLWSLKVDSVSVMVNAVQVTVTLSVFHPVAKCWIHRSGIAAKEFQLKKGVSDPLPENLSSKALERDVPIAKAEAFKNAVKSLGNTFGRSLNRNFKFDYIEDEGLINRILPKL